MVIRPDPTVHLLHAPYPRRPEGETTSSRQHPTRCTYSSCSFLSFSLPFFFPTPCVREEKKNNTAWSVVYYHPPLPPHQIEGLFSPKSPQSKSLTTPPPFQFRATITARHGQIQHADIAGIAGFDGSLLQGRPIHTITNWSKVFTFPPPQSGRPMTTVTAVTAGGWLNHLFGTHNA